MPLFSLIFIVTVAVAVSMHVWLARRQIAHVRAYRDRVPAAFRETIPLAAHQRAADYTLAKTHLSLVETVVSTALLLAWTLGGGLDALDRWWGGFALPALGTGIGFMLSVVAAATLLELPLTAYRTFVLEKRFGFNRTTLGLFITDTLKQLLLLALLGIPLAATALAIMRYAGTLWWVYAWLAWMAFALLMTWAYPRFIAPLFNAFKPLQDAALSERIDRLLQRAGFKSEGIYVMDGSRRSGHGNAYFTGLGEHKRIVFFDTLLATLTPAEIEAVLAHELGHFRLRHVTKTLIAMALLSFAGLSLLGWLATQPWFYAELGVSRPSDATALVLFALMLSVFGVFLEPMFAYVSRKREFAADDYAAAQTDPRALVEALVKLYRENASTLTPDPVYSAFHDSHPPAPLRVAHLLAKQPA